MKALRWIAWAALLAIAPAFAQSPKGWKLRGDHSSERPTRMHGRKQVRCERNRVFILEPHGGHFLEPGQYRRRA